MLLWPAWQALAADPAAPAVPEATVARQSAPVKVANRLVIELRGPIAGYSAQERATNTMERIGRILEAQPNAQVSTESAEGGIATRVLLGGSHAFLVTPVDIDPQTGETTALVAREAGKRLEQAVADWRETRTPRHLAMSAGMAVLATLVYALALSILRRVNRWISERLSRAAAARAEGLQIGGLKLLHPARILTMGRRLVTVLDWGVGIVLTVVWLAAVLNAFPFTRPWGEQLDSYLLGVVTQFALSVAGALPGIVVVILILALTRVVDRTLGLFFERVSLGRVAVGGLDPDNAEPTRRIVRVVLWIFALAMAYPYLPGAQTDAFKGLSVLVGLMVSLGAASVVGQAFNGLILMYSQTFRKGDYVRVGDVEGTVAQVGTFVTRIRTGMGEEITLPNSGIMAGTVRNYSRSVAGTGYVVDTVVTIGYSTPWRQVIAMLEEAALRCPGIARTPPPIVRQTALSDFYVEYRLIAYTPVENPRQRAEVLSELHGHIQDVFNEYGVQIMSPHYLADPPTPQVVAKKDWFAAPARSPEDSPR
jgi:small-conductance mechanosensitive channel